MTHTLSNSSISLSVITGAERAARWNASANLRALQRTQPRLAGAVESIPIAGIEWVFARDQTLTAIDQTGRWWSGCSLPTRAATFMFEKADLSGVVVCMLSPVHAAQVRVALDRMRQGQAMVALVPESRSLRVLLECDDFSAEIAANRLFFAWGENWETQLDQLLEENPGLATPSQFIRPILADSSSADALMPAAQKIFGEHGARRTEKTRAIRAGWVRSSLRKICLVAPSQFRLWDDAGSALADALGDGINSVGVHRFDSDNPRSTSPLALATAAATCDAIITPNLARGDLPDLAPDDMPWTTWVTIPRIPPAAKAGRRDTLLVADPVWKNLAVKQGWNAHRVFVAGWPVSAETSPGGPFLAIISDTRPLDPPPHVTEYSSHRLLWEAIQHELLNDPWRLGESADDYLDRRIRGAGLEQEGLDRSAFIDGVIRHAYQQGIAAGLLAENVPLKIFGHGWDQLDSFAVHAIGAVQSREQLRRAADCARALIHVWPARHAHPIESLGKPVVAGHQRRESFIGAARGALAGKLAISSRPVEPLSAEGLVAALSM
ncbi:MAG TPA: hypothetical protein VG326_16590 [Tepidisphaeraceae bacterium]|jgi:hypothetical protein|nr:hypothetical protein [Tepidisphaeraceae bacterium]